MLLLEQCVFCTKITIDSIDCLKEDRDRCDRWSIVLQHGRDEKSRDKIGGKKMIQKGKIYNYSFHLCSTYEYNCISEIQFNIFGRNNFIICRIDIFHRCY